MGKSLLEQLAAKGIVAQGHAERVRLELEVKKLNEKPVEAPKGSSLKELSAASDMYEFGQVAERILTDDPSLIGIIIQKAHRFKSQDATAKAFIWRVYRVRDLLPHCPDRKRAQFLSRAFRRHDPKVEIPE